MPSETKHLSVLLRQGSNDSESYNLWWPGTAPEQERLTYDLIETRSWPCLLADLPRPPPDQSIGAGQPAHGWFTGGGSGLGCIRFFVSEHSLSAINGGSEHGMLPPRHGVDEQEFRPKLVVVNSTSMIIPGSVGFES